MFLLILFAGCSTQKDIIREKIISIKVPAIEVEQLEAEPVNVDPDIIKVIDSLATDSTYYESEAVTQRGDSIKVKFYLKDKETEKPKFDIKVKPAPVEFKDIDTTHIVQQSKPFSDYLNLIIVIAAIVLIIFLIIKFKK